MVRIFPGKCGGPLPRTPTMAVNFNSKKLPLLREQRSPGQASQNYYMLENT